MESFRPSSTSGAAAEASIAGHQLTRLCSEGGGGEVQGGIPDVAVVDGGKKTALLRQVRNMKKQLNRRGTYVYF